MSEQRMIELYGLVDPRTGKVRYVGKANDSRKRLATHFRDARRRDTPVYRWMRKLQSLGLSPGLLVLDVVPHDHWKQRERDLIAEHRRGGPMLNVADGGDEPFCPPEVRAENGRKVARIRRTDPKMARIHQIKMMLGQALRQGYVSEATKAKMRLAAEINPRLFGQWASI